MSAHEKLDKEEVKKEESSVESIVGLSPTAMNAKLFRKGTMLYDKVNTVDPNARALDSSRLEDRL